MGLIFLLVGILLFGSALWLWQLIRTHIHNYAITKSLSPEQAVKIYSISQFYLLQAKDFLLRIIPWLLEVLEVVMALMPLGVLGIGLFLFIDGRIALSIFILIVVPSILYVIVNLSSRADAEENYRSSLDYIRGRRESRQSLQLGEVQMTRRPIPIGPIRGLFERKRQVVSKVIKFSGEVTLPKQVYINRNKSLKISVELMPEVELGSHFEEHLIMQNKETGTSVTLWVQQEASEQFLQVELQAPAFTIAGDQKQKHLLNFVNPHKVSYQWSLFCPNSGNHPVSLIFSMVTSSDSFKLGETAHEIRVRQLDHLSQTQVRLFSAVAAIIGTVNTVIGIIVNFPTLLHLFVH